ncbi:MAG TPA: hypothetical protein VIF62_23780, partial [Labilithrix sp.]
MAERAIRGARAEASPRSTSGTRRGFSAIFAWHVIGTERVRLMRNRVVFVLAFATTFGGVAATGCRRDDDQQRRANERAEHIAQETTITSGELTRDGGAEREAVDDELREQASSLAAFRREQLATKTHVQKELDALDRKGASPRRAMLRKDLEAIDRATEADWPSLRQRIEKDVNPAPAVVPRSERLGA